MFFDLSAGALCMSIETWDPSQTELEGKDTPIISSELLIRFIQLMQNEPTPDFKKALTEEELAAHSMLKASEDEWNHAFDPLDNESLLSLLKFFTLIEEQIDNWKAGPLSPVIIINKTLRKRGEPLSKEILLWIRQNSSNRFIPNGAVL